MHASTLSQCADSVHAGVPVYAFVCVSSCFDECVYACTRVRMHACVRACVACACSCACAGVGE